jgi:Flp pilus assembly protein TadD
MNQWDSAAYYLGRQAERFETPDNLEKAGEAYFQAQGFAISQNEIEMLGQQARMFFDKVLVQNPQDLEVKTKIGLTYIASSNPMQGIIVLREVLEVDPNNEMALYNMGILSMQSSQWERAVERFTKLIAVNPENSRAHFYLGLSYLELDQKQLAKEHLLKVKELEKDPEVLANVDSYLEDIEN